MLVDKFLEWLKKNYGTRRGGVNEAAADLGIDQGHASRILQGKSSADLRLSHLERLATKHGFRGTAWRLVKEIEQEKVQRRGAAVVPIEERHRQAWEDLFRNHPVRGEQVLVNMRHQEALGYTDLVSEIVREIIDKGPNEAAIEVATKLHAFKEEKSGPRTRLRRKLAAEYEEIE